MKQIFALSILLLMLLSGGCDRSLDSDELGFNPPTEPPVPVGLKIVHLLDGIELRWQISDTNLVSHFNIYHATSIDEESVFLDSTSAFSLAITTLNSGQEYYFQVTAVDTNQIEGGRSLSVTTQVGVTSLTINGGDIYTNDRDISLGFAYPVTPILVQISEASDMADAVWQSFRQPGEFRLSDGDGTKFVYARFRFGDGSESSGPVSDSIILDTRANIVSINFDPNDVALEAGDQVTFFLDAGEPGGTASISFPGLDHLNLYDAGDAGDALANDGIYTRQYIVPINLEVEDGVVTGHFVDAAGNSADNVLATEKINIDIAPEAPELQAIAVSSSRINLSWSEINISDFTSYRVYRATSPGVTESSELVADISSRTTVTYADEDLDDNQLYVYRVFVYTTTGPRTSSNESSATTMVNEPPTAVTLAVGLSDLLIIDISWTANHDDDFESYQIYRGNSVDVTDLTGQRLVVINDQGQTSFTDFRSSELDTYYYVIYVYDRQGLKSLKSNVESTP